jgi:hypothetical protein
MRTSKYVSVVALSLLVVATAASAQARQTGASQTPRRTAAASQQSASTETGFWELGTDVGLAIGIGDPRSLAINIPTGVLRAGYYVTPNFSLEPQLAFNSFAQESQTAFSSWMLNLTGLWHFSENRRESQLFLHPGIAVTGGSGNFNPTFLSAAFGMKKPMMNDRLVMRAEAGLSHRLKEGAVDAATSLIANFGWSIYTR